MNAKLRSTASLDTSYINNEVQGDDFGKRDSSSLVIQPTVGLILESEIIDASFNVDHRFIRDSSSIENSEDIGTNDKSSLTNYSYRVKVNTIQDILSLNASGSQTYRNVDVTNVLINNEDFGNKQLAKTRTDAVGFDLTLNKSKLMGFEMSGNTTSVNSDESSFLENGLDSTNDTLGAVFYSGPSLKAISWNFVGNYNKTQGRGSNDIESRTFNGNVYLGLFSNLRLVTTAQLENNILTSTQDAEGTQELEYNSYGAGLSWYRSAEQFIDITYNESSKQEGEKEHFIGTNFSWRFSPRTKISGEYGRRFYGESGRFSLNYDLRKLRIEASYTEEVTSFTRLIAGDTVGGIFVCPIGSVSFFECFIPESLDYDLQPGEEFTALNINLAELSEESTLRKSFQLSAGYNFRRFSAAFTLVSSDFEYVQTLRKQQELNSSFTLNVNLSKLATLSWTNTYGKAKRNISELSEGLDDRTISSTLTYRHSLSRNADIYFSYQITNRASPVENRDFISRRSTVRYSYKFK